MRASGAFSRCKSAGIRASIIQHRDLRIPDRRATARTKSESIINSSRSGKRIVFSTANTRKRLPRQCGCDCSRQCATRALRFHPLTKQGRETNHQQQNGDLTYTFFHSNTLSFWALSEPWLECVSIRLNVKRPTPTNKNSKVCCVFPTSKCELCFFQTKSDFLDKCNLITTNDLRCVGKSSKLVARRPKWKKQMLAKSVIWLSKSAKNFTHCLLPWMQSSPNLIIQSLQTNVGNRRNRNHFDVRDRFFHFLFQCFEAFTIQQVTFCDREQDVLVQ